MCKVHPSWMSEIQSRLAEFVQGVSSGSSLLLCVWWGFAAWLACLHGPCIPAAAHCSHDPPPVKISAGVWSHHQFLKRLAELLSSLCFNEFSFCAAIFSFNISIISFQMSHHSFLLSHLSDPVYTLKLYQVRLLADHLPSSFGQESSEMPLKRIHHHPPPPSEALRLLCSCLLSAPIT